MKIFFYTTVFAPKVGRIEMIVETLCKQFVALGHKVALATETPGMAEMPFAFSRRPGPGEMRGLLAWCDIHIQANISLKAAWVWALAPRKTLYQHHNVYQCDDGTKRLLDRLKTRLARATPSIANSAYTAVRTGAKHIILNAYDDATFHSEPARENRDPDLVFLGRLVSQKGCHTLIDALRRLSERGLRPGLTVIGAGPEREKLARQAKWRSWPNRSVLWAACKARRSLPNLRGIRLWSRPRTMKSHSGLSRSKDWHADACRSYRSAAACPRRSGATALPFPMATQRPWPAAYKRYWATWRAPARASPGLKSTSAAVARG